MRLWRDLCPSKSPEKRAQASPRKEGREIQVRSGRNKRKGESRKAKKEKITPHRC